MELTGEAREWLATEGYDPAYGARPLKRVIQKYVQDPLAEMVLAGKIHDGETVKITYDRAGETRKAKVLLMTLAEIEAGKAGVGDTLESSTPVTVVLGDGKRVIR